MILKTEELKNVSAKILSAVDPDGYSIVTETLDLSVGEDHILKLSVTNREYFVQVRVPVATEEVFEAEVNALTFLKLVSQITTETVEFTVNDRILTINGNGTYKLPIMIDESDNAVKVSPITIDNKVNSFNISGEILNSIYNYNSKELSKLTSYSVPVQRYYYVDNEGAITYSSGACVNNFTLDGNVSMLLSQKVVKLFKLFGENDTISFTFGADENNGILQNKASFETQNITISTLLQSDENMIKSVPVQGIRNRANNEYSYSANINKDSLVRMVNRIMAMYSPNMSFYSKVTFNNNSITIKGVNDGCSESLYYNNDIQNLDKDYECILDLKDLKLTLDGCSEAFITVSFGDNVAIVVSRGHVKNVIPEVQDE